MIRNNNGRRRRAWTAALLAVVMLLACAVSAAAEGQATTRDGLYVTDDGAYGVYVVHNTPGSVGIAKCYLDTLPADYAVPTHVSLNGAQVPVRQIASYAFEDHPEMETVLIGQHISLLADYPFRGCTGLRSVYMPGTPTYSRTTSTAGFASLPHYFEIEEEKDDPSVGMPEDYIDIELSTKDLSNGGRLGVTCTLRDGVDNFVANLYTDNLEYESMDPADPGAEPVDGEPAFLRLGLDPVGGDDYGKTRTFYFTARQEGRNASIDFVGSVLRPGTINNWIAIGTKEYYIPNNTEEPERATPEYPKYLPLPVDVAPMQQETLDGTNAIRAQAGSAPLESSYILNDAAMVRATEMALAEEMSHTRPDGSGCDTVLRGYGNAKGENVVMLGAASEGSVAATSVRMWRNSQGHYENMVEAAYTQMGVGYARGRSGAWYGCQLFSDGRGNMAYSIDTVKMNSPYVPDLEPSEPTPAPTQSARPTPSGSPSATPAPSAEPTQAPASGIPPEFSDFEMAEFLSWEPQPDGVLCLVSKHLVEKQGSQTGSGLAAFMHLPEGWQAEFLDADGNPCAVDEAVGTGYEIRVLKDGQLVAEPATCVIAGDVTGNGKVGVTDVVQMADMCRGADELVGPCFQAADLNSDGRITLADLVAECALLRG